MKLDQIYLVLPAHPATHLIDHVVECAAEDLHLFCSQITTPPVAIFSTRMEAILHAQQLLIDQKLSGLFPHFMHGGRIEPTTDTPDPE